MGGLGHLSAAQTLISVLNVKYMMLLTAIVISQCFELHFNTAKKKQVLESLPYSDILIISSLL